MRRKRTAPVSGMISRVRRLIVSEIGEGSIAIMIGSLVFLIAIAGALTAMTQVSDASAQASINSQRKVALQGTITDYFNKVNWTDVLSDSTEGVRTFDQKRGSLSACTSSPCQALTGKGTIPLADSHIFPYQMLITPVINTLYTTEEDGTVLATNLNNYGTIGADDLQENLTNSDGSYRIQMVAPTFGKNLSDCSSILNPSRPYDNPIVSSGCIYVSGIRTPTFSDTAVAGDWLGLTSTNPTQITGTARYTYAPASPSLKLATIDTCKMAVPTVRVTFLWRPDPGSTVKPVSLTRFRSDGVAQETLSGLSSATPVAGKPFTYVSDFTRGTSSLCGDKDSLVVNFDGNVGGQGSITALQIVPVKMESSGSELPGPIPSIRLQSAGDDPDGYQIVWDEPVTNTAYPPTSYKVSSTCNPIGVVVPAGSPSLERGYTGGAASVIVNDQPILDYMNSCPVWSVTPTGVNGDGPKLAVSLSSIPLDFVKVQATYTAASTGKEIKVSFNIPEELRPLIKTVEAKYCYQRPEEAIGCSNPFLQPDRAVSSPPAPASTTEILLPAPTDLSKVKDGLLYVQLILTSTSSATGLGHSNLITLSIQQPN